MTINNKLINLYNKNGYLILKLFSKKDINYFEKLITNKAKKTLKKNTFNLPKYHNYVNEEEHNKIIKNTTRCISVKRSIIKKIEQYKIISDILKTRWNHSKFYIPNLEYLIGKSKKTSLRNIKKNEILFRIVPPKSVSYSKTAPEHVDLNAGKIINHKNKILIPSSFSIWVPIIGFTKKYTLRFSPGSHLVNHPLNKIKKQSKYISPVFDKKYINKFEFKRLNLNIGEVIFFDLNLLHGGADNLGTNSRTSLEIRLYNHQKIKFK